MNTTNGKIAEQSKQKIMEAELSRKTFYRLFPDKEAVLKLYFDFWESKKDILLLFKKNALLPFLFECVYEHSSGVFAYVRSTEMVNTFSRQLPYLLAYAVGGMHSMLLKWVENDMVIPSSELIQSLKKGLMSPDI